MTRRRTRNTTPAMKAPTNGNVEGSGTELGGGGLKFSTKLRFSPWPKPPGSVNKLIRVPFISVSAIELKLQSKKRCVPSVSTPVEEPHPLAEMLVPAIRAPVVGSY